MDNTKQILNCKEVAEYLGMNYFTIIKYARTGILPAFKTGKEWKFHRDTLDAYIKEKMLQNVEVKEAKGSEEE